MPAKYSAPDDQQVRNLRTLVFGVGVVLAFVVLSLRMLWLQTAAYEENSRLSENNRIRKVVVRAERGLILDREGRLLVRNRPSYQIALLPYELRNEEQVKRKLLAIVDSAGAPVFDSAFVDYQFQRGRWIRFRPHRLMEDASPEQVALVEEHQEELPGIVTVVESRRDYPYGSLAAHALGYTGEVDERQLDSPEFSSYTFGDRIGKKGLEESYEQEFRGTNGIKYVEVNAYGREIGMIEGMAHEDAIQGRTLVSTLDLDLQRVAESVFPDSIKGALVAIDPRNGEVLVMVSSPRMDPNIFSLEKRSLQREWAQVAMDSAQPLNNRAIQGLYDPGSTFKFFTAVAGLEYGYVTPTQHMPRPCTGGYQFGARYQRCWKPSGHGHMNVVEALKVSCDVWFYQLGLITDMGPINKTANAYGLGRKLGIDIPSEKPGLLIDSASFERRNARLKWRWSRGLILNLAIGQGELVTPLQMAAAYGALGRNEGLFQPHLMKEIRDPSGTLMQSYQPHRISDFRLKPENYDVVLQGLEDVVSAPGGTGSAARVPGVRVGGKSGSAENPHGDKTHAWFAAVAPLDNPTIAIACVMENAGHGGSVAAPPVGKLLNYYFRGTTSNRPGAKPDSVIAKETAETMMRDSQELDSLRKAIGGEGD